MEAEMSYLLEEKTRKLENAEMLIERLKREVMALSFSVELHDRAAKKARAIWAEAHPDDAEEWLRREDLMVWLMDRVERAEAVKESLKSALLKIRGVAWENVWNLATDALISLRTTEETNNDTHDRPVETLLLIKELGRMSKKLDALKGSLRNIADNAAHWDTGRGPDASAFGWIHDIAETALRTAEESSVVDSTPAKQPPNAENADGDGDSVIDDNPLQFELDREKRKNEDLYRDFKGANDLYLAENLRAEKLRMALWEIRHIIWKNARMRWYSVGFWKLLVPIFSIAHNALQPSEKSSEIMMDKKPGAEVTE